MQEDNKIKKSFHQNMKAELKKVIWPTGKQVVKNTFATIAFVLLISVILIVLNLVFNFLKESIDRKVFNIESSTNTQQTVISSGDSGDNAEESNVVSGENAVEETAEGNEDTETTEETQVTENSDESVVTE